jgi:exonuclease III
MAEGAVQDIYNFFEFGPSIRYERILGKGRNGVACVVREEPEKKFKRRLVVKRATTKNEEIIEKVKVEIRRLEVSYGFRG